MNMTDSLVTLETLKEIDALWQYRPGSPVHAQLTSGLHSDLFLNMSHLIERPRILAAGCEELLRRAHVPEGVRFVGSAMGSITIAHECARLLGATMAYTEKDADIMRLSRFSLEPGEKVVMVEDVLTTGGTTKKTRHACAEAGAEILPFVLSIINRSGMTSLSVAPEDNTHLDIIALIEVRGHEYVAEECPMCKECSVAKRPKGYWYEFAASQA